jgi:thiol-disulfide isomerase/thioredoxin
MLKFFRHIIFIALFYTTISCAEVEDKMSQMSKITEQTPAYTPEDVPIFDAENKKHFLEEYEGKTVLLVFWATWCAPCVAEMADLDSLQKDFRKLSFIVLPISEDYVGVDHVSAFYKVNNLRHLPVMHDYKNALFKSFDIVGLPTSILVNSEGMAVAKFSGAINWYDDKVREMLLKYIPGNPAVPRNSYKDNAVNYVQSPTKSDDDEHKKQEIKEEPKIENEDDASTY